MSSVRGTQVTEFGAEVSRATKVGDTGGCRVTARSGGYDLRLSHDHVGKLGFVTIAYGNAVEIATDPFVDHSMLHLPLAGGFIARSLGPELEIGVETAHILGPTEPGWMGWDRTCRVLAVRLENALIDAHGRALSGGRSARTLPESVPLSTPEGATFRRWVEFIRAEAAQPANLLSSVAGQQAQQMFYALLFAALERLGATRDTGVAPYYLKRAQEFIVANLEDDIGLVDVVAASGVSLRTLYYGFAREHGVGPMAWLKQMRLERLHAELLAADPATTSVTEIATRWRFWHLGRLAGQYQARFGELPSETLRKVH